MLRTFTGKYFDYYSACVAATIDVAPDPCWDRRNHDEGTRKRLQAENPNSTIGAEDCGKIWVDENFVYRTKFTISEN